MFPGTCTLSELIQEEDDLDWKQQSLCSFLHLPQGLQYPWGFGEKLQEALEAVFIGYEKWPSPSIERKKTKIEIEG